MEIPRGTPPPKVSAEVWGRSSETQYDTIEVADVVRIDDACIVCRKPWPDEYGAVRVHVTCAIRWYWARWMTRWARR